ncbi:MAG: hypothetical protein C0601_01200 [Candidatus Muiribacterium halophilum]|uniref:IrrE N-terminal-like domain-containing protein n=1 Tax=Muiribacterium halophilum TaxID=2053465 RepID=A0A2N5ZM39_MUIH1|nr:MAG: hypothetical protein C0601_01200 [Candidatus Muirbacterium halophilum]
MLIIDLIKHKGNIPGFIFPLASLHLMRVKRNIPNIPVNEIIEKESIKITYKKMKFKGKYKNKEIFINPENKDDETEIILHELFHYFEEKYDLNTLKLISEAAARLYTRISY